MVSEMLQSVEWSRAQFALTAIYHWLFVPLTLGLSVLCALMETRYYRTGDPFWRSTTKFWMRLFGINFAIGVATGLILEFEFGTNWSNYSNFVGDIFGAPLAIEGIMAFFLESTFVAVMFFGWDKVSRGFHLSATWLTAIGANLSALWILVANSWMQYPVGCSFNIATVRNEMDSFWDVLFSPVAINKFSHTVTSSFLLAAIFVMGVSAWYLLRGRHRRMARSSIMQQAAFCPPVMMSVFAPTSNCGVRFCTAAISPRSSISEMRSPWSDSRRTHSRSSVVFPPPGGERMSVLQKPSFISCGTSASAHPGTACGMRTDTELSCRMPSI